MRIVAFSDSHTLHESVRIPDGDLLIFAGDLSLCRTGQEAARFNRFLATLPHTWKVIVAGNHDQLLAQGRDQARDLLDHGIYLEDETVSLGGLTLHGSPWQPRFSPTACDAFALPRGRALAAKWAKIPAGLDILITHTPPLGVMDENEGIGHGCSDLLAAIGRVKPRFHIFGHIHNHNGIIKTPGTTFINCNVRGAKGHIRPALVFDLP